MSKDSRTDHLGSCASLGLGGVVIALPLTQDIGRRVVSVMLGGAMFGATASPNPNIKWCAECKKYYNSSTPHECLEKELRANRERLESWLGKYKVHD